MLRHLPSGQNMSRILGIFDGTHDAGACLIRDGAVVAACDEERWTRKKGQGGFPIHSIQWILQDQNISWRDIDHVALAGFINPNPLLRLLRPLQQQWRLDEGQFYAPNQRFSNWVQFRSPFPKLKPKQSVSWRWFQNRLTTSIERQLQALFEEKLPPVKLYEHHMCHAASAHFASGHSESLILVADGLGDGLALSIWRGTQNTVSKCFELPYPHSLGLIYASITGYLGYKPFRHEGKVTGLSARGNAKNIDLAFPFEGPFPYRNITTQFPLYDWLKRLDGHTPMDIAAWLQSGIEKEIIGILRWAQAQFGKLPLTMAGGLVANVALNATISRDIDTPDIFVFPNMGDAGLATGAAYLCGAEFRQWKPKKITSVYWGPDITQTQTPQKSNQFIWRKSSEEELLRLAGKALANGKIVARAVGRMEYGPRALGHRSILCSAGQKEIHSTLNTLLSRTETMPFAPIMRKETATQWLNIPQNAWTATEWMTITVQAKRELIEMCPAIVHVDGSLRPQLVSKDTHPVLWQLLYQHEKMTGEPALINTSFNRHEEPIVCTHEDALRAFVESGLDALWLGNRWVEIKT